MNTPPLEVADIVRAAGATVADIINAWAHGRAVVADAKTRRNLFAQAAKQPDKVSEFERLIRLQPTNANLPMDRRMSDDHIARIAAPPKPRTKSRPGGEPEPGGKPEPGGQLLHLRQSPDE